MKQPVLFLLIMVFVTTITWAQTTHTVCSKDYCDYTSIQAAVNAAKSGDSVKILEYTNEGNINIDKELTFIYQFKPEPLP